MVAIMESVSSPLSARRVSWGAIFAGTVVALAVHVVLAVLGIAIGASVIDPATEANPVEGIGVGSGIYFVISAILALLAGGFVAGALASLQTRRERSLHGLATWGVVTLLSVILLATGLGRLVGGTMNIIGAGLSQASRLASAVAEPVANRIGDELQEADIDIDQLRREAAELLRDTGQPELRPGEVRQAAQDVREEARSAVESVARDPQAADEEIQRIFDRIQSAARETMSAADREALVNVLVERTDMSRPEAQQTVANWERTYAQAYRDARAGLAQVTDQAEEQAREWGQQMSDAIAAAAWWSFIVLVLGAIAAVVGANMGSGREVMATRESVPLR
ncbi:MAG: hypothetical protein M3Q42_12765 [Pseudomonadota bacterium]|nr:hypothetical protein [Pseudomonadota bacterium]